MLSAVRLTSVRGNRLLFKNFSFEVKPGELIQVQGENGSGKSTLLRILCGLREPDEGGVYWQDCLIQKCKETYFRALTYIGHMNAIRLGLSPLENLNLFAQLEGVSLSSYQLDEALSYFDLAPFKHTLCKTLSVGQRRKVALTRLVYAKTSLWILDEPFSGLDRSSGERLQKRIEQHVQNQGMVIFSSHHPVDLVSRKLVLESDPRTRCALSGLHRG